VLEKGQIVYDGPMAPLVTNEGILRAHLALYRDALSGHFRRRPGTAGGGERLLRVALRRPAGHPQLAPWSPGKSGQPRADTGA
ncbi:MAG: hypothetical protein ACREJF_01860, partial [Candidatus Methylomirabilales bacterium]